MASNREDFLKLVRTFLQDAGQFLGDSDDLINCLNKALEQYSEDKPLIKVSDTTGDGTKTYSLPSDFVDQWSVIRELEFPTGNVPPTILIRGRDNSYEIERTTSGIELRFFKDTPSSSETFRLTYTAQHSVTTTTSTVITSDEHAVAGLTASYCLDALARRMTQAVDPTITADSTDRLAAAAQFALQAERAEALYNKKLGKVSEELAPVSRIGEVDVKPQIGGQRLFHHHRRSVR